MDKNDSWWVKLWRADRHLQYIQRELRRYSNRHPYGVVRVFGESDEERRVWRYDLIVTEKPDPKLSAMIGDCVHNVRCALDHVVAGHAPSAGRSDKSSFPIRMKDPWETRPEGGFVFNDKTRRSFDHAIRHLPRDAVALIKALQPYRSPGDPHLDPLAIIAALDNADKHRQITTLLDGVENISTRVLVAGEDVTEKLTAQGSLLLGEGMAPPGTPVAMFGFLNPPPESEVDVKVSGTATVAIRIEDFGMNYLTTKTLQDLIDFAGDGVLLPLLRILEK